MEIIISKESIHALNEIMHELYIESYKIKGIGCALYSMGLKGFNSFTKNESHERWKYGSKVKKYILNFGGRVILPMIPESETKYPNALDAVTMIQTMDRGLLEFINQKTKEIAEKKEWVVVDYIGEICEDMIKEFNEVSAVVEKTKMIGPDLVGYDIFLYEHYQPMSDKRIGKY